MSLDGIAIRALSQELKSVLLNGRIDKITQPNRTTTVFQVRVDGQTKRLIACINPQNARLSISQIKYENPPEPPLFCMVLRKHLIGAQITNIEQLHWERIIRIQLDGRNEIGERATYTLLAELMGKSSNLLLLDDQERILDAARRIGSGANQYRQIGPGLPYVLPPPQNKLALEDVTEESLAERIFSAPATQTLQKILLQNIAGIGPQTAQVLLIKAQLTPETTNEQLGQIDYTRLNEALQTLHQRAENNNWQPTLIQDAERPVAFAPFPLPMFSSDAAQSFPSMSALLDTYYGKRESVERFLQKRGALERIVQHEIARCEKKLSLQMDKIYDAEAADQYRLYGELITANLYQIKQGPFANVPNFYAPEQPIIQIPLDASKTPNENAQRYFNKYTRAKNGALKAAEQAEYTRQELDYLLSVMTALERSENFVELQEIRLELATAGYVRPQSQQRKNKAGQQTPQPLTFTVAGFEVLVGKNNTQNDHVTLRMARGKDLWLHTQGIHGAHVIIRQQPNKEIPNEVREAASLLAAWFSKARHSTHVPVDITEKKYVHKPKGAKPGMVIYTNQQTVYVTPAEEKLAPYLSQIGRKDVHVH